MKPSVAADARRILITTLLAALTGASVGSAQAGGDPPGKTRFGQLSVAYGGPLLLDDKPLQPEIHGSESIDILNVFRIGPRGVILLQTTGGAVRFPEIKDRCGNR